MFVPVAKLGKEIRQKTENTQWANTTFITEKYQNFTYILRNVTENHVPKVERQQHHSWITEGIRDLFGER